MSIDLRTPAAVDVFTRILTKGPIGRVDIARQAGLSQAAVTKAVTPLIAAGIVTADRGSHEGQPPGRPVHPLRVVPDALLSLGIKINRDEVIGVVIDLAATVLNSVHVSLADVGEKEVPVESVVEAVVVAVRQLVADLATHPTGVGVSVSGDIDASSGVVRDSPLLGWHDVALGTLVAEATGLPTLVENDVRALTVAEQWFGVGVDAASFAIVTIGAGIGCGLYLNGDVVSGAHGVAGEIGHLPLAAENLVCTCGRHGCVETVASSAAILARVREALGRPDLTLQQAVDLAHAGEGSAVAAFDRAGTVIGAAIAAVVNLTGPQIVLVAGESVADYDLYEQRLRQAFAAHAFGAAANARIVTRSHTFDDWARGAASCVIRARVRRRPLIGEPVD